MRTSFIPFAALCLSCFVAGCATQGLNAVDDDLKNADCTRGLADIASAETCLADQENDYLKSALELTNENVWWNYGFTAGAAGGAGAAAFDSHAAALKAIGLALGSAVGINQIRAPSATATLYLGAAKAMSCMYSSAQEIDADYASADINTALATLQRDIISAQSYENSPAAGDKDLQLLETEVTSANSAAQVAQNALVISDNPGAFLLHQADDARLQVVGKLNAAPVDLATVQQNIAASITNQNTKVAAIGGANAPIPAPPAGHHVAIVNWRVEGRGALTNARDWTLQLQLDITKVLKFSQGFADAKANVPVCLSDIPT